MSQKPSIPKGTRDFGQQSMAERNYIFETIKKVFRTFGYAQIETPAMENLSTLLGKYGEEGDKLLFRVLNSGDCFSKVNLEDYCKDGCVNSVALSKEVCEKGLRYDLTVPFARFVVQHQSEISFPYKRFQIQPVWRADRPQKGRYREFYQCDVDVIGSKSQVNELELVQIVDKVFSLLDVNVLVKINNRKVLTGFAEVCGFPDKVVDITVAIDKLDKIGLESVEEEMREKGLTDSAVTVVEQILKLSGSTSEKLSSMRSLMSGGSASGIVSETGLKGLDELDELFGLIDAAGVGCPVEIDLSLARGLNYYTGAIFEVKALDFQIGSICGGGRYDNLTGIFGLPDMSGVGISSAPTGSMMSSKAWTSSLSHWPQAPRFCLPAWVPMSSATFFRSLPLCVPKVSPSKSTRSRPNLRNSSTMPKGDPFRSFPSTAATRPRPEPSS